jgi:DNA repair exonuclease SbcCD ATPase subunit
MTTPSVRLASDPVPTPHGIQSRFDQLEGRRRELAQRSKTCQEQINGLDDWLKLEKPVADALDALSRDLFAEITSLLEEKLSIALQEVLEQGLLLKVRTDYKRGSATIGFTVERDGNEENILKGMGGSVANVLSVGLRLFALTTLDEQVHRRFLVLDEQDCWLRPDIVPKFVRIIHEAGRALGFQVLMISHHDASVFQDYADRIIRLDPTPEGVQARIVFTRSEDES